MTACASSDKLVLDKNPVVPNQKCGIQSYLNRYATYKCASLELEDSNDHVNSQTPIHNIKDVVLNRGQNLLVIDEKKS